jgi:hypothetical protein
MACAWFDSLMIAGMVTMLPYGTFTGKPLLFASSNAAGLSGKA